MNMREFRTVVRVMKFQWSDQSLMQITNDLKLIKAVQAIQEATAYLRG